MSEYELPDSLMQTIKLICNNEELTPVQKMEATVLIAFGYGLYSNEPVIDPKNFRLSWEQWDRIATLLGDVGKRNADDINGINMMLDWMNYGPSATRKEN